MRPLDVRLLQGPLDEPASTIVLQIHDYQRGHEKKALETYQAYVKLFEQGLDSLVKCILGVDPRILSSLTHRDAHQMLLTSRVPKTLWSSFDQTLRGAYDESIATTRVAYETLLRVCFAEKYPADWTAIFGKPPKGTRAFKASSFMTQDAKVMPEDYVYRTLSYPIHGQLSAAFALREALTTGNLTISLGFRFDRRLLGMSLNLLLVVEYFAVRAFVNVIAPKSGGAPHSQCDSIVIALTEFISTLPRNVLSSFPGVLDRLFVSLGTARSGFTP